MSETEATNLEQILIFLPGVTPILHRIIFHLVWILLAEVGGMLSCVTRGG